MKFVVLLRRILPAVWLGMVGAIAMEAQLKFQAPGITRELGLGIGKLVFTALNRIELVIAFVLAISFFAFAAPKRARIVFGTILIILLAQTLWLMPNLIARIDLITSGQTPPDSSEHFMYIAFEIIKDVCLLILSVLVNYQFKDEKGY